jgi:drug/metabolite transporter (DMT)-like permease
MSIKPSTKGYIFTTLATISFSNVYIFSKAALNEIAMPQFWFYWFLIGLILNIFLIVFSKKIWLFKTIPTKSLLLLPAIGVVEILTSLTFFISINAIPDPAVTGFLGNLFPLFAVILGVTILKERFSLIEAFGVFITLLGALIISYSGKAGLSDFFIPGVGYVVLNSIAAAVATIIVRIKVRHYSPEVLNLNRTFWLFLFGTGWIIFSGDSLIISSEALTNISIGAVFGPFIAVLFLYKSLKYIEASRSTIIQSLKGLFVMVGAYIYFYTLPLPHQITGGIISIIGVVIIVAGKTGLSKLKKN